MTKKWIVRINILDTIPVWETWTLIVRYVDISKWEDNVFWTVKLKDIKEERKVLYYVGMCIENIFVGIPDIEMEALRQNTNIQSFFDATSWTLTDEQITELFKDFHIFHEK